jgi:hypothetical protein
MEIMEGVCKGVFESPLGLKSVKMVSHHNWKKDRMTESDCRLKVLVLGWRALKHCLEICSGFLVK